MSWLLSIIHFILSCPYCRTALGKTHRTQNRISINLCLYTPTYPQVPVSLTYSVFLCILYSYYILLCYLFLLTSMNMHEHVRAYVRCECLWPSELSELSSFHVFSVFNYCIILIFIRSAWSESCVCFLSLSLG